MSEMFLIQWFAILLFGGAFFVALGVLAHDRWGRK